MTLMNDSTDFYDALAPMFDVMTDWDARLAAEGPFLLESLEKIGARRVLDAACGSGGHALWLAGRGYDASGADSSLVMIEMARRKAAQAGVAVRFETADLSGLAAAFDDVAPFDAVLCLGNSLPHLLSQEALVGALRAMAGVLRPGGLLLLQNLNYDLRWQRQPRWFAAQGGTLDGVEVLVWRFADYLPEEERIAFHIALFRRRAGRDWQPEVHTAPQRPLFQRDLNAALDAAGFTQVEAFERMALPLEPFDPEESGDLVVTARRAA
jgi:SAM-dependent methyltransferase